MTSHYTVFLALAIGMTTWAVPVSGQRRENGGANAVMPWAFVLNDPVSGNVDVADPDEVVSVPGSPVSMPRSAININDGPPDWHPNRHPPMPEVVATGAGDGVAACG